MNCSVSKMSLLSWQLCPVLLMLLWSSQACFIRNCPRGGKRSMENLDTSRQCMSCGPGGAGQCVGPSICCGSNFGCMMGTAETEVCQKENESTVPCTVKGRQCGLESMGNCVADGICCIEDACSFNSQCKEAEPERQELLTLIHRLLANRNYD